MSLRLVKEGDWVVLSGAIDPGFVSLFKFAITPSSNYKFDPSRMLWLVHWSKLHELVDAAGRFYTHVDWSTLPEEWQRVVIGAPPVGPKTVSPYRVLFVTEDAPMEVVRAAYQALTHKYHPDQNQGQGDQTKLQEVLDAYRAIRDSSNDDF